jgi:4-amino-4-deoxy-L-arabinose transferase-like glycosyltransferase
VKKFLPELALTFIAAVPLFLGLGDQLFETDPAQYAEVARRMVASGDYLRLKDNFGAFLNKPPVTMWLEALSMKGLGVNSAAVRLPSLLMALALLAIVARVGSILWDRRAGLIAAAFLAGSFAVQLMVLDPKVDTGVTLTMALTVWALLEARRRPSMVYLAWGFAALGVMTKGPIGLAVPAVAVFPEAVRRRWGASEAGSLWSRVWTFKPVRGVLIVLAIMAPWYWAVIQEHGWGGPKYLIWEQSFSRVLHQSDYKNATTPLFFLHTGLWAFLPFTPLFLWVLWRAAVTLARRRTLPPDETRVVWWWFLLPFLVISFAEFRLPQYLFWLAPPAALLCAREVCRLADDGRARALKVFAGIAGFLAVASFALEVVVLELIFPPSSRALEVAWLGGTTACAAALFFVARRWTGARRLAAQCVASTLALSLLYAGYVHPALAEFQPDEAFGRIAKREDPQGKALPFICRSADNAAAFYADRPASEIGSVEEVAGLVNKGEVPIAVAQASLVDSLRAAGLDVQVLAERPSYPISRPRGAFLNAQTRPSVVERLVLVRLRPKAAAPASK